MSAGFSRSHIIITTGMPYSPPPHLHHVFYICVIVSVLISCVTETPVYQIACPCLSAATRIMGITSHTFYKLLITRYRNIQTRFPRIHKLETASYSPYSEWAFADAIPYTLYSLVTPSCGLFIYRSIFIIVPYYYTVTYTIIYQSIIIDVLLITLREWVVFNCTGSACTACIYRLVSCLFALRHLCVAQWLSCSALLSFPLLLYIVPTSWRTLFYCCHVSIKLHLPRDNVAYKHACQLTSSS